MTYLEGKRLNAIRAVNEQRIRLVHLQNAQKRVGGLDAKVRVTEARLEAAWDQLAENLNGAAWVNMSDDERAKERAL